MTTIEEITGDAVHEAIERSVHCPIGDVICGAVSHVESDSVWESARKKVCRRVWLFTSGSMHFPLQSSASEIVNDLNLNYLNSKN